MRRDARKVHALSRPRMDISLCGRYVPEDPATDELVRMRMTSAVTCKHCRDRHRRGETAAPGREGAAA